MSERIKPMYVVINLESYEVIVYGNKTTVAKVLGVHRNSITFTNDRRTIGNYLIIETKLK